jgi:hypothetical protein
MKLILLTILAHLVADFTLQGWFCKGKQELRWIAECKKHGVDFSKYRYDYIVALILHSLYWSIAILIPAMFMYNLPNKMIVLLMFFNTFLHFMTDDLKANRMVLNLVQDQISHFIQIAVTLIIITNGIK